ncbi:ferredoxin [Nocardioides sp.]|uniref:ferredoxin n=1 Tax=Nocardioides sp. TaxID=35761 RepID=UPI002CB11358|nr:ferredoxin [Nocardioides sp.]HXH79763.1 ferredoxin [Nocardioides sp.]
MKVSADLNKCEGLGMCEAMAPDVFEVQDEGQVVVLDPSPAGVDPQELRAAVDACPVSALSLQD